MTYKILIVDDEPANLRVLERLFASNFEVFTAASGEEGLKVLGAHDVALIISDQRMPGMSGVEFLKRAAELRASTVRMILTGYTDIDALVESINSGVVYRYITKPWSNPDLQQTVKRALEYYEAQRNRFALEQENLRMQHRAKATIRGYINLALEMLDIKSPRISEHARRTAKYAAALGKALNFEESELEQLFLAAILHEVAHVRLPAHLMSRTTLLRDGEFKLMQEHFKEGIKLLAAVPDLEEAAAVIDFHHDHWDGHGSINRLCGEQIPLHARMIAIADSYDEM
ncbi:MAG: response regulator, partial [Acidobacteria bacterium]|nr:response regulator [Acidobacteriota bacterium]